MTTDGRLGRAEVFLQWKGTNACYDFYCPCNPGEPQHFDGFFGGTFICGGDRTEDNPTPVPEPGRTYCGKRWQLAWTISAAEIVD